MVELVFGAIMDDLIFFVFFLVYFYFFVDVEF